MAPQYIPSGMTSMVKRGKAAFQVQTEYARIPRPRITTTIFSSGQVLHKIEKLVEFQVTSIEEMHEVEDIIKAQHLEVSRVLRERGLPTCPESTIDPPEEKVRSEQIRRLEGVERVYLVTAEGKLIGDRKATQQFKKIFKHVLRELPEMLKVFASLPGGGELREEGIYEVEPGRILLASTGVEFFLILLRPGQCPPDIAVRIRDIIQDKK